MFCDSCGTRLHDQASFCNSCGKSLRAVPFMPQQGRIAGHVRLLGIFWLALSAMRVLPGLFIITFFGRHGFHAPLVLHGIIQLAGLFLLFCGVTGIIAGWGLLERQPWARTLAIVLACFNLIEMPFGTALGIYTLWVLLPGNSEAEYRSIARAA